MRGIWPDKWALIHSTIKIDIISCRHAGLRQTQAKNRGKKLFCITRFFLPLQLHLAD